MDTDKSGFLDHDEIVKGLREAGHTNITDAEVENIIKQIDADGNGKIDYNGLYLSYT
jgi:Ca2+-binding EF-hand superfamily protein